MATNLLIDLYEFKSSSIHYVRKDKIISIISQDMSKFAYPDEAAETRLVIDGYSEPLLTDEPFDSIIERSGFDMLTNDED
jgi:hypothetical protein